MKKTIQLLFAIFTFSLIAWQCQYPIDTLPQPDKVTFVVITAEVTETYGKVAVERSSINANGGEIGNAPVYLKGIAYILDSKGTRTDFAMDGTKNKNFQGKVGESYQLFVETEGKKYQSLVEVMPPSPPIDTVKVEFNLDPTYTPDNQKYYGFDVSLDTKDLPEKGNYYQWEWVHYQRQEYCGLLLDTRRSWDRRVKGVPCYEDCFKINYNPDLILLSDELVNGNAIRKKIDRVGYFTPPNKYYLSIEQRAITKNAYNYFNSVIAQTQNNGNQYDIPAQTLFSTNLQCTSDPQERVLGVFNLYSSHQKIVIIDRGMIIPNAIRQVLEPSFPLYVLEGLESFPFFPACGPETRYNTKVVPDKWED